MAVAKMRLVNIIGHINALDPVIFACGSISAAQPDDALTFFSDTSDFSSLKEENPYLSLMTAMESAAARIGEELLPVNVTVTPDTDKNELASFVNTFTNAAAELTREKSELVLEYESISRDLEQFKHFCGLGFDLNDILNCKMIKVRFGRLPKEGMEKLKMYDANPYVIFFPAVHEDEYYWGVYFAPLEFAAEVDHVFSGLYFERLRIPAAVGTPAEIVENLKNKQKVIKKRISDLTNKISFFWQENRKQALQTYAKLRQMSYYFSIRRFAARYHDEFILTGWIPKDDEEKFRKALSGVDAIEYTIEEPDDPHHTPPVKLKNLRPVKRFEFFVNMYGLPRYNEIDPTFFVCFTYVVLFGIMFGDLGQGLIVSIVGWLMWKLKGMMVGRILIPCGFSSMVFGAVFGSVFGFEHLMNPVYHAVFGWDEKPIEVLKPSTTPLILLFAAAMGILLIVISMALGIVSGMRQRDYEAALFGPSGAAGMVFYVSLIIGLVSMLAGVHIMNPAYILLLIILPLLIMFLREPLGKLVAKEKNWKPESWGEYCVQSFFELFEVMLGYLSNTMSFLRVGAFVLVHAGMMMAVFTLAGLTSGIFYWIIVVFGNALVIVMEALLVAIQVMRLEFYEMFSRYYKGDGRPFRPIAVESGEKVYSSSDTKH